MSTGSGDLEKARKYFEESIDSMKSQIEECILHHKFLPNELVNKLNNAYQGMLLTKIFLHITILYVENFPF